jgi:nucleotide-binding universal stress UspA family protein
MKTIAILTDFSERSAHAAKYALHIAKKMKVNVRFYQLQLTPAALQKQPVLNGDDYTEESISDNRLAAFSEILEADLIKRGFPGSFMPQISTHAGSADMVDVMTEIINDTDIAMIVMAPLETDDLASFMLSDACGRIIDWTTVPVMVVPPGSHIHNIEKMAFATTLDAGDLLSIAELGGLMDGFHAELMVAHLNNNPVTVAQRLPKMNLTTNFIVNLIVAAYTFAACPIQNFKKIGSG